MANKELVYLSDVRRSLLRFEPGAVYTLEGLRRVDAVEVVRCKDCKYWEVGKAYEPYCNHPCCGLWDTTADDFCSYGKRRTDG